MFRLTACAALVMLALVGCEEAAGDPAEVEEMKTTATAAAQKEITADNAEAVADQLAKEIEADLAK